MPETFEDEANSSELQISVESPDIVDLNSAQTAEPEEDELEDHAELDLFNLDCEEQPETHSRQSQPRITLSELRKSQDTIEQIQEYAFEHEQAQWTEDEFEAFRNPPEETWTSDDPNFQLSLEIFLALSSRASEATYETIRRSIERRFSSGKMLSFDQVRGRLQSMTGITPLHFDMCINSCLGYTGVYDHLSECPYCGEDRYSDKGLPRRQFVTLPLGPQLQALWRHPESVAKLRDRLQRTACALAQRDSPDGILDYDDLCCGSEYLDHVESGKILDDDMVLVLSMDGAQLYRDKGSDTLFAIGMLADYAPEIRHQKDKVMPLFTIGGPNSPKNYDSFFSPTIAHLSACQRLGLPIWDSSTNTRFLSYPWFMYGTADTVGMTELSGSVGHHGRNGCRLLCAMPGRHKPGVGTYYPAMLQPTGNKVPIGASHPTISITSITTPSVDDYKENLQYVLASPSGRQFERRRRETGLRKPSIISALPKSFPVPKCFPADTMHLFSLNLTQLLVALWRGTIDHAKEDNPTSWPFAVLHDVDIWKQHGAVVAAAGRSIPVCLTTRVPRNPAEKISSGYKAIEYMVYIYGLCPALLYGILPEPYYRHFCKLVFATRIIHKRHKSKDELLAAHRALLEFVYQFELLYYCGELSRLHFVRPCVHALTHIVPEHFRIGSLTEVSQWTMERTIGNLGEEIRLHSDPYANLSQRIIERAQINALYSAIPELLPEPPGLPRGACDLGNGYALLGPRELRDIEPLISSAFHDFAETHGWRTTSNESLMVHRFARLLLPNGQTARSWWQEQKRPSDRVRIARNVKV
jgi:hypothetical protein